MRKHCYWHVASKRIIMRKHDYFQIYTNRPSTYIGYINKGTFSFFCLLRNNLALELKIGFLLRMFYFTKFHKRLKFSSCFLDALLATFNVQPMLVLKENYISFGLTTRATLWRGSCESRQICWRQTAANLLETNRASTLFYSKCIIRKCLTFKIKVKITEYNIHNSPIRWQISTSVEVILEIFRQLSPFSKYLHFKNRDLENVGQGHDVQNSRLCHSMANTRLRIQ